MEAYPDIDSLGHSIVVEPLNATTEKVWWSGGRSDYYIRYTKEYADANFEKFNYNYIDLGKPFDHALLDQVLGLKK